MVTRGVVTIGRFYYLTVYESFKRRWESSVELGVFGNSIEIPCFAMIGWMRSITTKLSRLLVRTRVYYLLLWDNERCRIVDDESPWGLNQKWIGERVILFPFVQLRFLKFERGNCSLYNVSSWNSKGRGQVYFFGPKCFRVFTLTLSLCPFLTRTTENFELRLGAFFEYERQIF